MNYCNDATVKRKWPEGNTGKQPFVLSALFRWSTSGLRWMALMDRDMETD